METSLVFFTAFAVPSSTQAGACQPPAENTFSFVLLFARYQGSSGCRFLRKTRTKKRKQHLLAQLLLDILTYAADLAVFMRVGWDFLFKRRRNVT